MTNDRRIPTSTTIAYESRQMNKTKRFMLPIALLFLGPLLSLAAEEPVAKRFGNTPPGKEYIYKHSAGRLASWKFISRRITIRPRPKCPA